MTFIDIGIMFITFISFVVNGNITLALAFNFTLTSIKALFIPYGFTSVSNSLSTSPTISNLIFILGPIFLIRLFLNITPIGISAIINIISYFIY